MITLDEYNKRIIKPTMMHYLRKHGARIMFEAWGPLWFWLPYSQEDLYG